MMVRDGGVGRGGGGGGVIGDCGILGSCLITNFLLSKRDMGCFSLCLVF